MTSTGEIPIDTIDTTKDSLDFAALATEIIDRQYKDDAELKDEIDKFLDQVRDDMLNKEKAEDVNLRLESMAAQLNGESDVPYAPDDALEWITRKNGLRNSFDKLLMNEKTAPVLLEELLSFTGNKILDKELDTVAEESAEDGEQLSEDDVASELGEVALDAVAENIGVEKNSVDNGDKSQNETDEADSSSEETDSRSPENDTSSEKIVTEYKNNVNKIIDRFSEDILSGSNKLGESIEDANTAIKRAANRFEDSIGGQLTAIGRAIEYSDGSDGMIMARKLDEILGEVYDIKSSLARVSAEQFEDVAKLMPSIGDSLAKLKSELQAQDDSALSRVNEIGIDIDDRTRSEVSSVAERSLAGDLSSRVEEISASMRRATIEVDTRANSLNGIINVLSEFQQSLRRGSADVESFYVARRMVSQLVEVLNTPALRASDVEMANDLSRSIMGFTDRRK